MSDLRAALVAIQELHKPIPASPMRPWVSCTGCVPGNFYPCATRRLADEALTARTTKNGDNK